MYGKAGSGVGMLFAINLMACVNAGIILIEDCRYLFWEVFR